MSGWLWVLLIWGGLSIAAAPFIGKWLRRLGMDQARPLWMEEQPLVDESENLYPWLDA